MPRFEVSNRTSDGVQILVEGRVTLIFRNIEGRVSCVSRFSFDRGPLTVSRKDFLDARKLATGEMAKVAEEEFKSNLPDSALAEMVLANVKRNNISPLTALNDFFKSATWCNPNRKLGILQEIGKIGGHASKVAAKARKNKERIKKEAERQGSFSFT